MYTTAPYGWMFLHGQEVLRESYFKLLQFAIDNNLFEQTVGDGKHFGLGDGVTTFTLPDFRETVLVGAGESTRADIASHDVYNVGEFKDDQMQGTGIKATGLEMHLL